MSFWPNDIFAEEVVSPRDIMKQVGEELRSKTTVLTVATRENHLPDRTVLGFLVRNDAFDLEFNLFEAIHRPKQSYPVAIVPPDSDIPEYLKRERHIPGSRILGVTDVHSRLLGGTPGRTEKNEWVCGTPQEFTSKVKDVLALDHVKAIVLSLLAPAQVALRFEAQSENVERASSEVEDQNGTDTPAEE